ncbi:MAG: Gfo/Idh/MocA family oxidoreductase [Candidatus Peribacteraceae bacterium]|nr:Gfo/Idh/MocA family oxidoreductase [Candidatus Peribacteraceae bacterium]
MMNKPIGIGVIGSGFGARVHVPAFRMLPDAVVVGIASRTPERALSIAGRDSSLRAFASIDDLIRCPDIDIVTVAVPPAEEAAIIEAAVRAGKHVFAEKPLGGNRTEAAQLLNAAKHAGIAHAVNFECRELIAFQELKQQIDDGVCGTLQRIDVHWMTGGWADPSRLWGWQCDLDRGGGVLTALIVHLLDTIEWVFGSVRRLQADLGISITHRMDSAGVRRSVTAPDHCRMLLELTSSCPVVLSASQVATEGKGHWIEVHGSFGSMRVGTDTIENFGVGYRCSIRKNGKASYEDLPLPKGIIVPPGTDGRISHTAALAERFVQSIRNSTHNFEPSFVAGLRTRFLLDVAELSARDGQSVEVGDSVL